MRRRSLLFDDNKFDPITGRGFIGGHEVVDLLLPSGTLWATCNVGCTKESDYGKYYEYGSGVNDGQLAEHYDFNTNPNMLRSEYDTATLLMGVDYRIPTVYEYLELLNYTTYEVNIDGIKFTSKVNPNAYVYFPICGELKYYGYDDVYYGVLSYLSSTKYFTGDYYILFMDDRSQVPYLNKRDIHFYHSHSVRGVVSIPSSDGKDSVITYYGSSKLVETSSSKSVGLNTKSFYRPIKSHEFSDGVGTITFDGTLSIIDACAFYSAPIDKIILPSSVKSIGSLAFNVGMNGGSYSGIPEMVIESDIPPIVWNVNVVNSTTYPYNSIKIADGGSIYVPSGSIELYKQSPWWNNYASVINPIV